MYNLFGPKVPSMTPDQVAGELKADRGGVLVDVRTPQEVAKSRIAESLHIPLDAIESEALAKIPNKETPLYVYCLSGSRSVYAIPKLQELGYTHVWNVEGGMLRWRAAGLDIEE